MLTQILDFFSCNSEFSFHLFFPDFWVYILQIFLFLALQNKNGKCNFLSHNSDFFMNYFQMNES